MKDVFVNVTGFYWD